MNKIERIQARINDLELDINRDKYKERKIRTRRLIQKGALLEKYFECEHLSVKDTEDLLQMFADYVNSKKLDKFNKAP
ncbi:hypothetical protein [Virgibacillus siamensis]|uniref:hypothetical protein n=1 Tax=Virgibacillus siamensis TaxID=480071 RepID=UPI00111569B7|nr:hypothetical protein [Virgibacillus siamensis]